MAWGSQSDGQAALLLAQAIVDSVRDPLLVLDEDFRVIAANRSFYKKFQSEPDVTIGRLLGNLGDRQWEILPLQTLLARIASGETAMEDYEVTLTLPHMGVRTLILNVRKVFYAENSSSNILLAFEDVTDRRNLERECDELLHQKDLLLSEMQHRIANSLSIIASILLLKARTVDSPETRTHLEDAHRRVLSVAAVQQHLQPTVGQAIVVGPYLKELCASLAGSMINNDSCVIEVRATEGKTTSATAVSVGLITTELVINALKHAFSKKVSGCLIDVSYEAHQDEWKLTIADNGFGTGGSKWPPPNVGLGTSIVNALAQQLQARVETESTPSGTTVSVTYSTFKPHSKAA